MYSYRNSLKSDSSDELINTYFLRPLAGLIVWALYPTFVTPNQITIASIISGLLAALFYLKGAPEALITAGLLITLKDLLDSADGQLARARQQCSRIGRFLDSIGDFLVSIAVFSAIGWTLYGSKNNAWMLVLAFLGFIGISLRVSYHVFYHVNFLHLHNLYMNNRITEEVQKSDLNKGKCELALQQIFQFIYGWQDGLMIKLDDWTRKNEYTADFLKLWYSDNLGLRISGFLGFGTELSILTLCSVSGQLELYLFLNLFLMNGILAACILYRRIILSKRLSYTN